MRKNTKLLSSKRIVATCGLGLAIALFLMVALSKSKSKRKVKKMGRKRMQIFIVFLVLVLLSASAGEALFEEWSKTFGGPYGDQGWSVQETNDGGYIITGMTESYGAGIYDVWLIKTNSEGNEEWSKTFGGSSVDWGFSVQETNDGGYIIIGVTGSYGVRYDGWLIKTTSKGNEEWSKTFGGSDVDWLFSGTQTNDGGYIMTGMTGSYGAGGLNVWLIKTDSKGNEEWCKTFGGSDSDVGNSVRQTSDGGYIIVASTESYGAGDDDVWLIKTDSKGNWEWSKTFGDSDSDVGNSVRQTSDGGYIIVASTESYGAGDDDVWLIKTDSKGNEEWSKTFGGSGKDRSCSVQETNDGRYIITGITTSYGAGKNDTWLIKTDSKGNEEWNRTFGGSDEDWGYSVQQTNDGGYIITGLTNSYGAGEDDVWLIKIGVTPTPEKGIPGFKVIFAIMGLLIVAYLLRRRK